MEMNHSICYGVVANHKQLYDAIAYYKFGKRNYKLLIPLVQEKFNASTVTSKYDLEEDLCKLIDTQYIDGISLRNSINHNVCKELHTGFYSLDTDKNEIQKTIKFGQIFIGWHFIGYSEKGSKDPELMKDVKDRFESKLFEDLQKLGLQNNNPIVFSTDSHKIVLPNNATERDKL